MRLALVPVVGTHLRLRNPAAAERWSEVCCVTNKSDELLKMEEIKEISGTLHSDVHSENAGQKYETVDLHNSPAQRSARQMQRHMLMKVLEAEGEADTNRQTIDVDLRIKEINSSNSSDIITGAKLSELHAENELVEIERGSKSSHTLVGGRNEMELHVIALFHERKLLQMESPTPAKGLSNALEDLDENLDDEHGKYVCEAKKLDQHSARAKLVVDMYRRVHLHFGSCFRNALLRRFDLHAEGLLEHDQEQGKNIEGSEIHFDGRRRKMLDIRAGLLSLRNDSSEWGAFRDALNDAFTSIETTPLSVVQTNVRRLHKLLNAKGKKEEGHFFDEYVTNHVSWIFKQGKSEAFNQRVSKILHSAKDKSINRSNERHEAEADGFWPEGKDTSTSTLKEQVRNYEQQVENPSTSEQHSYIKVTCSDVAWGLTLVDAFFLGREEIHDPPLTITQKKYESIAKSLSPQWIDHMNGLPKMPILEEESESEVKVTPKTILEKESEFDVKVKESEFLKPANSIKAAEAFAIEHYAVLKAELKHGIDVHVDDVNF